MFALRKLKFANHKMPIVTGRYANIPAEDQICNLCELHEKGNELHYLLKCPMFNDSRIKYIKPYYYVNPSAESLRKLFNESSDKDLLNLSKFSYSLVQYFRKKSRLNSLVIFYILHNFIGYYDIAPTQMTTAHYS